MPWVQFSLKKPIYTKHFIMKQKYVSKNVEETMETNSKAIKSTTMVEEKSFKPNLCLLK